VKERTGLITFQGMPLTLVGDGLSAGDKAPDFSLLDNDLGPVSLSDFKGKVCLLVTVPSLDTPVCDVETRRFNQEASTLGADVVVLGISMDLPFAQKRWCGAAGVDQVMVLSDHLAAEFGEKYGCLIKERRTLRRAVFVIDSQDRVTYVAYMPVLGVEPDYEEVLEAARAALA